VRAWAHFLAVSAAHPELAPSAITIGQAEGSSGAKPRVSAVRLGPLAPEEGQLRRAAVEQLADLVDLYRRGMREPLPLYCSTSAAWAAASRANERPHEPARGRWASSYDDFPGEDAEPEHVVVLGPSRAFEALLEEPPAPDEAGRDWPMGEPNRLGRLATRLWAPLLDHERLREH
jgi:exodeoxyribonuclease V gamma subunit